MNQQEFNIFSKKVVKNLISAYGIKIDLFSDV